MNTPLVSILIPCYNSEKWIAETIQSALDQIWKNKEIIVIDDGSTDGSLFIAKQFESNNVKVISQENSGASAARNRALIEAQGDFIQYLDADDLLAPDKIELQINLLRQGYSDHVILGEWGRFRNSYLETNFIKESVWQNMSPVDWLVCSWEGGGMMPLHSWLLPRNIIERSGLWNEDLSLNDDGEYFCRVVLASKGVRFCNGSKSYYRSGLQNSLSKRISASALLSAFLSIKLSTQYLLARENNINTRHACATAYQRFIYSAYPDVIELIKQAEFQVKLLGGTNLKIGGSYIFQLLASLVGWKYAKSIQKLRYSITELIRK